MGFDFSDESDFSTGDQDNDSDAFVPETKAAVSLDRTVFVPLACFLAFAPSTAQL